MGQPGRRGRAPLLPELESVVTGRGESFFARDLVERSQIIAAEVDGRRVLIVGGAGSIGAATTQALLQRRPAAVHVVDVSENGLAELVRDVRSGPLDLGETDFQTHVFDYGSRTMQHFLNASPRFDIVLNFAAVKHVRSERDVYSLAHMLDINIVRLARFKQWLVDGGHCGRFFTVSTDKAANPSSLMGASKRVMEDVAFDIMPDGCAAVSSARFANVAFSNGSLLQSFLIRLDKRQPLAVPRNTLRYFVSHAEAAHICLLASLTARSGYVLVPSFEPGAHLMLLEDVASRVLECRGYAPWFTDDGAAAKAAMTSLPADGRWPVLLTPLDTSGEKPFEEFVGEGEVSADAGFSSLRGVAHQPRSGIGRIVDELARLVESNIADVDRGALIRLISQAVPTMQHNDARMHLDQRM